MTGIDGPVLNVRELSKRFGTVIALNSITFTVQPGEFLAILGPSGCGKTTLLRSVAGFENVDQGFIEICGKDYTERPSFQRPLNTVFQSLALFPHMTVFDNVAYGPRRSGKNRETLRSRVFETLEQVGLTGLEKRYPSQISGGQQQRVALARALINKPQLLLLDEPLSALDLKLRRRMQLELKELQHKLAISFVLVTHDQEEAMTMANRIIVMNAGRIEQVGTPQDIYNRPSTRFVAEFIGDANFFTSDWLQRNLDPGAGRASHAIEALPNKTTVMVRPEKISFVTDKDAAGLSFAAVVRDIVTTGGISTVYLDAAGCQPIVLRDISERLPKLAQGDKLTVGFSRQHLHVVADSPLQQRP